jgi:hypothetical protein
MDDDTEKLLSDLFAEMRPADVSDDGFVTQVMNRITQRQRFERLVRACGVLVLVAIALILSPSLVAAAIDIAFIPAVLTDFCRAVLLSPSGWVATVLIAVFLFARAVVWTFDVSS